METEKSLALRAAAIRYVPGFDSVAVDWPEMLQPAALEALGDILSNTDL